MASFHQLNCLAPDDAAYGIEEQANALSLRQNAETFLPGTSINTPNGNPFHGSASPVAIVGISIAAVFVGLWIIFGLYCCWHSFHSSTIGDVETSSPESGILTLQELNERLPITKYKTWLAYWNGRRASANINDLSPPVQPTRVHLFNAATASTVGMSQNGELPRNKGYQSPRPPGEVMPQQCVSGTQPTSYRTQVSKPISGSQSTAATCAICVNRLDDDDDVRALACNHVFHASCIDLWLTGYRSCCPLCKACCYVQTPNPGQERAISICADSNRTLANRLYKTWKQMMAAPFRR